jgi:hypothetical protein
MIYQRARSRQLLRGPAGDDRRDSTEIAAEYVGIWLSGLTAQRTK